MTEAISTNERHTAERISGLTSRFLPPLTANFGWGCQLGVVNSDEIPPPITMKDHHGKSYHITFNDLTRKERELFHLKAWGATWLDALADWHSKQPRKTEAAA